MTNLRVRLPRLPLARLPMGLALTMVAAVWVLGCVWSFTEQTAFARAKAFSDPELLPLVIDGLAAAMGGVAFAASLDARPAVAARVGTALAVLASALSNGLWAAERSSAGSAGPDPATVAIGAGIPIAANIAFEVLLAELRRQVQRRRGLPAPAPLPTLRLARLLLSPGPTFSAWRREVLQVTGPAAARPLPLISAPDLAAPPPGPGGGAPAPAQHSLVQTGTVDAPLGSGAARAGASTASTGVPAPAGLAAPTEDSTGSLATLAAAAPVADPDAVYAAGTLAARGRGMAAPDPTAPSTKPGPNQAPDGSPPAAQRPAALDGGDHGTPPTTPEGGEEESSGRVESNAKVWRLAEYLRALDRDPAQVSGDEVVDLGLCSSARNGRRLRDRAVALCEALDGPVPPPRPDLSDQPRLLLPGEAPSLAIVAGGDT